VAWGSGNFLLDLGLVLLFYWWMPAVGVFVTLVNDRIVQCDNDIEIFIITNIKEIINYCLYAG
jgi:hypothetical protein